MDNKVGQQDSFDREQAERFADRHRGKGFWKDFRFLLDVMADPKAGLGLATWLVVAAAISYAICPLDAIPDFYICLGWADDAAVLSLAAGAVAAELAKNRKAP